MRKLLRGRGNQREPEGRRACRLVDSGGQYFIKNPGLFCFLFWGVAYLLVFASLLCWPQPRLNSRSRAPLVMEIKATDFTTNTMTLRCFAFLTSAPLIPPPPHYSVPGALIFLPCLCFGTSLRQFSSAQNALSSHHKST